MNANSRQILNALAAALLIAAASAPALASSSTSRTVSFDCANRSLPSLSTVGAWYGTNNAGRADALRSQLMGAVTRACHASADGRVDVVIREPAAQQSKLVAKSSGR